MAFVISDYEAISLLYAKLLLLNIVAVDIRNVHGCHLSPCRSMNRCFSQEARMIVVNSLVAQSIFGLLQILGWNTISIVYEKDTYEGMLGIIQIQKNY